MPNWVTNILEIKGSREDLDQLIQVVRSEKFEFNFNKVIPYPEEYARLDAEGGEIAQGYNSGGYEWCEENWGTKGNALEVSVKKENEVLVYMFDTAWSPSLPVTEELSARFPSLTLTHRFIERGGAASGWYEFKGGEVVSHEVLSI